MSISTSTNGVDANGDLFVYAKGSVSAIDKGYSVVNGTYNPVSAGDQVTLAGVVQFPSGSGLLQATGPVGYRVVTIGGAPPSTPIPSTLPISTSVVGVDASGNPVIYTPPYANTVAIGSSVTFGMWANLEEFDTLPPAPVIVEISAGAAPLQAMNQVVWRTVTLTPA